MRQKKVVATAFILILLIVCFSGCTSNQTKNNDTTLSGTWTGNGDLTMSVGRGSSSVTKVSFSSSTVTLTLENEQGTMTMDYNYTVTGDTLTLEPLFSGGSRYPGSNPGNWTMPPNGTRPWNSTAPPQYNGTWPGNGTRPENGTWPSNRTQFPGGGRPSMTLTLQYSLNKERTALYLNGYAFTRIQ